jgi:hypothetical protein
VLFAPKNCASLKSIFTKRQFVSNPLHLLPQQLVTSILKTAPTAVTVTRPNVKYVRESFQKKTGECHGQADHVKK